MSSNRDAKSYFSVLLDDNNRKPIARCYFNSKTTKWIGAFAEDKTLVRHDIDSLEEIYLFADELRATVKTYL